MENRMIGTGTSLSADPSKRDAKIRVLQRKLYLSAKRDKDFKAYSLYDKVCRIDVLEEAYHRVKSGKDKTSGAGVDEQTFSAIESMGEAQFLQDIQQSLLTKTYHPMAVRRVLIPKYKSKEKRPLGIPTIRDRVVQMAVKMMIEPMWEAEFIEDSYGFRPKRSQHDAIKKIKENIYAGYHHVLDADLSKYFDTIPHDKLMKLVSLKVKDSNILRLIHQWLKAPTQLENGEKLKNEKGTPQGGVVSPLLSNIYFHVIDQLLTNPEGIYAGHDIRIVRFADDFVLMSRRPFSKSILQRLSGTIGRMGLTLNKEKTKLLQIRKESLFFLGFEFRTIPSKFKWNKGKYTNIRPSVKSRTKLFAKIHECLSKRRHWTVEWMVYKLNEILIGWLNYFSITKVSHIWETVNVIRKHLDYKLYKWLKRKGRKAHKQLRQKPYDNLVKYKNLLDIGKYARLKANANATG